MNIVSKIMVSTRGNCDISDITPEIEKFWRRSRPSGRADLLLFQGLTGAITTMEFESGLKRDIPQFWETIIPSNKEYLHNQTWQDGNGHSHLRSSLQGTSFTVPFVGGKLFLGTWQQVVLIDFDNNSQKPGSADSGNRQKIGQV